ncbi:acetoacetyl-CoA reductase [[Empedobacter] haloabium]|uniref:Acetoacetyl-CoA reductase n=1 Tax=[Empedobacter] haloabium TaxID=592317 RepID=A0ABZ1URD7_9BURK
MSKVALVTGGTRGLGAAISVALQQAGHRVAATYHSNEAAAAEFAQQHGIRVLRWDVADQAACQRGVARVVEQLGAVDILVNNAGITRDGPLHRMSQEQWQDVIHTNLDSMFNMTRAVIEGMRTRGYGRIVNLSSVNGRRGQAGQVNYAAAKAGVIGFTRALALENARRGITVNAVAPGYCDTAMVAAVRPDVLEQIVAGIPLGRLGRPEEVARVCAFLADEASGYITGATIDVNGGLYPG